MLLLLPHPDPAHFLTSLFLSFPNKLGPIWFSFRGDILPLSRQSPNSSLSLFLFTDRFILENIICYIKLVTALSGWHWSVISEINSQWII